MNIWVDVCKKNVSQKVSSGFFFITLKPIISFFRFYSINTGKCEHVDNACLHLQPLSINLGCHHFLNDRIDMLIMRRALINKKV